MEMGLITENMRNVTKLHDSTVHSSNFEKKNNVKYKTIKI